MGGRGSGEYTRYYAKTVVEDCHRLSIGSWQRAGLLVLGKRTSGAWCWRDQHDEIVASIGYIVNLLDHAAPRLRLEYHLPRTGETESYAIALERQPCHYGGFRWWYRCPAKLCGRRCGMLYLPPGGNLFACRRCYRLAYQSSNESRPQLRAFAAGLGQLDVEEIAALPSDEQLLPVLEALLFADREHKKALLQEVKRQRKARGPGRPPSRPRSGHLRRLATHQARRLRSE